MPAATNRGRRRVSRKSGSGAAVSTLGRQQIARRAYTRPLATGSVETPKYLLVRSDYGDGHGPFETHIRTSFDELNRWLEDIRHDPGAISGEDFEERDELVRTGCDSIMEDCGYLSYPPELHGNAVEIVDYFTGRNDIVVPLEKLFAGVCAIVEIAKMVCDSQLENRSTYLRFPGHVQEALWTIVRVLWSPLRSQHNRDRIDVDRLVGMMRDLVASRHSKSLDISMYGPINGYVIGLESMASLLIKNGTSSRMFNLAKVSRYPRDADPADSLETPDIYPRTEYPTFDDILGPGCLIFEDQIDLCAASISRTYQTLSPIQQHEAAKEVANVCDGAMKYIMAESVSPSWSRESPDLTAIPKSFIEVARIINGIASLHDIASEIIHAAPAVIPMYLIREGSVDRLCSCLLSLSWALGSQDHDLVRPYLLQYGDMGGDTNEGLVGVFTGLGRRMKDRGYNGMIGFERVAQELRRYIV